MSSATAAPAAALIPTSIHKPEKKNDAKTFFI
jgi:hypothetical protein